MCLCVGQQQRKFGGDFNPVQSFAGEFSQFSVWNQALPPLDVSSLSASVTEDTASVDVRKAAALDMTAVTSNDALWTGDILARSLSGDE